MTATATARQLLPSRGLNTIGLVQPKAKSMCRGVYTSIQRVPDIFAPGRIARLTRNVEPNEIIFSQGEPCKDVIYIQQGEVKLSVLSYSGKEAIVAILRTGDFFGEGALLGQTVRRKTATSLTAATLFHIDRKEMVQAIHGEEAFSDLFLKFMLERNNRIETDLIDQLFNFSEKRLARMLLLLAGHGRLDQSEWVPLKLSQETLAGMVGTTRGRINMFLNKFKKLGFIQYNRGLHVNGSLLGVVLQDERSFTGSPDAGL
jgi:CRP-like cAMP-binding protein